MKLSSEMPQLIDSNWNRSSNFDSIKTAIAYLSAPDEVKAEVDASSEPENGSVLSQRHPFFPIRHPKTGQF
jgi:hypothetical protein